MSLVLAVLKLSLLAFYLVTALSYVVEPLQGYSYPLSIITLILFVAHVSEFVLMKARIEAFSNQEGNHFINTLLFGFGHWLPLLMAQKQKSSAE